jgi:hypothetical protein
MHKGRHGDPVWQVFGDSRHRDPGAAEVLNHPTGGIGLGSTALFSGASSIFLSAARLFP